MGAMRNTHNDAIVSAMKGMTTRADAGFWTYDMPTTSCSQQDKDNLQAFFRQYGYEAIQTSPDVMRLSWLVSK
jgi:hypothetical protein